MEWSRAKNFVIVLLLILNGVLFGLNTLQKNDSAMTASQEKAIFEVLSQNGVSMYTELITSVGAKNRLSGEVVSFTKENLEGLFFKGEKTRVSALTEETSYRLENKKLTVVGNRGTYIDYGVEKGVGNLSQAEALRIAEKWVLSAKELFGNFELNLVTGTQDGYKIQFTGLYQGELVFSNEIMVFVSEKGIYEVHFSYSNIKGKEAESRNVCLSDEALLAFLREWKVSGTTKSASIQKMELGYDLVEQGTQTSGIGMYLEPCYRIYLLEEDEPYLINAYTCQIVKK